MSGSGISVEIKATLTGTAIVEPGTGSLLQATATTELVMTQRQRESVIQAKSVLEVKLERGAAVK